MRDPGRIVIIGAGPTGLGAAYRLEEAGYDRYTVVESRDHPGGLASSFVDDQGFVWDVGGHVQFSHYSYYDRALDRALGDQWLEHERESWVWIRERFVPYPMQYNLHRLGRADCERAVAGLEEAEARRGTARPRNFGEWIDLTFGEGLAELFMRPYNFKVWGYPPEQLDFGWIGERVAVPDLARVRENVRLRRDDVGWGPNNRFRFPLRGGTGAIWKGVHALLDSERFAFARRAVRIDPQARRVVLADGETLGYDHLVSTIPLDRLCALCTTLDPSLREAARELVYSACHIVGVGLRGARPETLARKCWMYFPESNSPYYRVTVFSNYSPHHVPPGGGYWSLMAEVCETPVKPVDGSLLLGEVVSALREDGLIGSASDVVSIWHHREDHGYPTPFLGRDDVLGALIPGLEEQRIFSRGRFGAWKYEVSNQDHSFMQGVELVERLLGEGEEVTYHRPSYANSGVFVDRG